MTPPTAVIEDGETIVVRKLKGDDQLEITLHEVVVDVTHAMDFDADRLTKDGVEADLQVALADAPHFCGEGFRLVRREWPTDIGPVDLMCRDAEDGWIAVEIKRVGTIDAVEQLSRYLERIRLDPAKADCRGVLAAQSVKPQARVLAESRGLDAGSRSTSPSCAASASRRSRCSRELAAARRLLAVQRHDERARAAVVAVLAQVDALPGADREPAAGDRERQRRAEQRRLDVRGHVVRALDRVRPVAARPRGRPR